EREAFPQIHLRLPRVIAVERRPRESGEDHRHAAMVSHLPHQGEAAVQQLRRTPVIALRERDPPEAVERHRHAPPVPDLLAPCEVRAILPEAIQRSRQTEPEGGIPAVERPPEDRTDVIDLTLEPLQPLHLPWSAEHQLRLLREREIVRRVPPPRFRLLAARGQL